MCALRGPLVSSRPLWTCLDLASPCLTKRSRGLNPIKPFVAPTKWEQNETNWDKIFNSLRCLTDASSAHTPYSCLSQALLGTFNQARTAEQHRIAIRFAAQTDLGHIMSSSDSSMQKYAKMSSRLQTLWGLRVAKDLFRSLALWRHFQRDHQATFQGSQCPSDPVKLLA